MGRDSNILHFIFQKPYKIKVYTLEYKWKGIQIAIDMPQSEPLFTDNWQLLPMIFASTPNQKYFEELESWITQTNPKILYKLHFLLPKTY